MLMSRPPSFALPLALPDSRSTIGNGPIESIPLKAQVNVTTPKNRPMIMCQRFQPL